MSAWERCAHYYLSWFQSSIVDWRRVEAELGQIQRAWAWVDSKSGDEGLVLEYVWGLHTFLEKRGLWREAIMYQGCISVIVSLNERRRS